MAIQIWIQDSNVKHAHSKTRVIGWKQSELKCFFKWNKNRRSIKPAVWNLTLKDRLRGYRLTIVSSSLSLLSLSPHLSLPLSTYLPLSPPSLSLCTHPHRAIETTRWKTTCWTHNTPLPSTAHWWHKINFLNSWVLRFFLKLARQEVCLKFKVREFQMVGLKTETDLFLFHSYWDRNEVLPEGKRREIGVL